MEHPVKQSTVELARWSQQLDELLKAEGLADRSQFLEPMEESDEVPLYVSSPRIAFLADLPVEDQCIVLLAYALDYLDEVVKMAAQRLSPEELADFFLMLTVKDWDYYPEEVAKPHFWTTVCAREELQYISTAAPYSEEARTVERWIKKLGREADYQVSDYDQPCDDPVTMRVFVGHRQLPRSEMPTMSALLKR